jgi:hypothetical protein
VLAAAKTPGDEASEASKKKDKRARRQNPNHIPVE